jgi:CxxC-x17-CxxC domain-containing protein
MNDNRSGRNNFGRRDFNSGPRTVRQMTKTVCSDCGRDCEVPFVPSGSKPVYCSVCFDKYKGNTNTGTGKFADRGFRKPYSEDRNSRPTQNNDQYNIINSKLDKILSLLNSHPLAKVTPTPKPQIKEEVKVTEDPISQPVVVAKKKKKASKKVEIPQTV